ncbi:hypothetical protein CMQ_1124 [Grosmannia clavigera kw1407]|uniref:Uncharacterized protein n=1 Tax=Grosmannia clavigera (strain kw1407 / UAMH 11150) TaxID=655863 RepID=F0XC07_GROCL|nr:uncharacterized protein CMQ_1124 [Grosmannia clavigera kw1407]EFX04196.1 hypothetical protein CMQ_1124 [Grosmannia clavigera kw1407]
MTAIVVDEAVGGDDLLSCFEDASAPGYHSVPVMGGTSLKPRMAAQQFACRLTSLQPLAGGPTDRCTSDEMLSVSELC